MRGKTDSAALADDAPHLLVVDDDRRIRDLLSRFLLGEGYRVTTAETAAEARAKLEGLRFDLLILDVMMPGETGFEFARSLRTTSTVPIVMLTARGEAESRALHGRPVSTRLIYFDGPGRGPSTYRLNRSSSEQRIQSSRHCRRVQSAEVRGSRAAIGGRAAASACRRCTSAPR